MMSRLERIYDDNFEEFLETGFRVLVLTQKDCPHCRAWSEEISEFLDSDQEWTEVRFGKIDLESDRAKNFKEANEWLEFVPGVPFNVLFKDGQPANSFAGSGVRRLVNRLQRLTN
jgi:hypothetical protein